MRITDNTCKILNLQPNIQGFKETRKIPIQINAKGGGRITGMVGVPYSGMVGVGSTGIYNSRITCHFSLHPYLILSPLLHYREKPYGAFTSS